MGLRVVACPRDTGVNVQIAVDAIGAAHSHHFLISHQGRTVGDFETAGNPFAT